MKKKALINITLLTLLAAAACNKIDDGRNFAFRKTKGRLKGEWELVKYTVDNVDKTNSMSWNISFTGENSGNIQPFSPNTSFENDFDSYIYYDSLAKYQYLWPFQIRKDKEIGFTLFTTIIRTENDIVYTQEETVEIYKLKNKELVLHHKSDGTDDAPSDEFFYFKRVE